MSKFVLIPDSFKGTLSSLEICRIAKDKIESFYPEAEILSIPVADRGEGSVDCFISALGGEKISVDCKGPYMEDITSFYGFLPYGAQLLVALSAVSAMNLTLGAFEIISHMFYPMMLLLSSLVFMFIIPERRKTICRQKQM
ncbi:MAG: glycerate kinase [Ruminococcaceae bacterium]|nr:glycerate kinase [Oscillospiraceae bacterium]